MNHATSAVSSSMLWLAVGLFVATYAAIISEKVNRAIVALLGAGLMIVCGVLNQQAAIDGVDFNTLGLLAGMMIIVNVTKRSGLFQYVAVWSAKRVKAHPIGIMLMMSLVTALFSALLDNVTTVLLMVPVILLITEELKLSPYPYLLAAVFMSNIGGTATLIGDPPNIMIGSAVGLGFNDFLLNLAPIIAVIMLVTIPLMALIWRKQMVATPEDRARVMAFNEREAITDVRLLRQSLFVLFLVMTAFILHGMLHLEPATVAMLGAALLLLLDNFRLDAEAQSHKVHHAFAEIEWITLFFFVGLFIAVRGLEQVGAIDHLAQWMLQLTKGDMTITAFTILWGSAIASAFVDNIPFVATMIPLVKSMAPAMGGEAAIMPLWWSLALGACLGGNGSLVGASANLVVAGFAERAGSPIRFIGFLKVGFPLMLLTVAIAHVYIYLRYL
jgi:Na+/H+ antiporter NhaD/arsenite permease-like protein